MPLPLSRPPVEVIAEPPGGPRGLPAALRCVLGVGWRVGLVLGALVAAGATGGLAPALGGLPALVVLSAGVLLGLWHRRSGLARLWRWAVLGAVLTTPIAAVLGPEYGRAVALLLVLAAACVLLAGMRRAPLVW